MLFDMPPWSLVSPASRGIGFALAKRILQTTNAPVVATARKDLDKTKEELLQATGADESRLTMLKLDVLGTYSVQGYARREADHAQTKRQLPMQQQAARNDSVRINFNSLSSYLGSSFRRNRQRR
jgi:NAD(P)-dependent dehydrogenase (short-subunit alcohol dehydrogenase family)